MTTDIRWLRSVLEAPRVSDVMPVATDWDLEMTAAGLAGHDGDPVAAADLHVDAGTAAFIRSLPVGVRS